MSVINWTILDVKDWLIKEKMSVDVISVITCNCLDGPCILSLNERDFSEYPINTLKLGDRKHLFLLVKSLQRQNQSAMIQLGLAEPTIKHFTSANVNFMASNLSNLNYEVGRGVGDCRDHLNNNDLDMDAQSSPASEDGRASRLKPEVWKAFLSLCYVFLVTWVTAVVMVIVHDKVPDMKKYPPLPDLFLDNVPHIPWAFDMCEITGSVLMAIWIGVLLFHKHRFILLRRFFALSGTVFLLRCITMLITSLSVPGGHLKCAPRHYPSDTEPYSNWNRRLGQAYAIWTGAGMSVRGVRTCGDYMFSGHTVALTLLNFFITEYTSRSLYLLHIVTWLMNMFGIFFILAAHEHYSIDVFIAFYITSRLFLYYHTLSNNQALMQGDSMRTRIWFPLLSFFESEVDGIVPNEYENPLVIFSVIKSWISQLFRDISESSVARMAGNSLSQQAAKADFSVSRLVDNIKKNIITPGSTDLPRARKSIAMLSDKNVQASMSNDADTCQLQHCIGAMCKHDVVLPRSSDSVHLKDN